MLHLHRDTACLCKIWRNKQWAKSYKQKMTYAPLFHFTCLESEKVYLLKYDWNVNEKMHLSKNAYPDGAIQ